MALRFDTEFLRPYLKTNNERLLQLVKVPCRETPFQFRGTCRDLAQGDTDVGWSYNNRRMGRKHSPAENILTKLSEPSPAIQ